MEIDKVYHGVVEAILKCNCDTDNFYFENNYSIDNVSNNLKNSIFSDINKIYTDNKAIIDFIINNKIDDYHGFGIDLYLTQHRHGAGFWDKNTYGTIGLFLTNYIHNNLKEYYVYISDFGTIDKG